MPPRPDLTLPPGSAAFPPAADPAVTAEPAPAPLPSQANADTPALGPDEGHGPATSGLHAGAGEVPVARAHSAFVAAIASEKPARIAGGLAEAADVEERGDHIAHVVEAFGGYVTALVEDLNANLPVTSTIDLADWSGLLADITSDHLIGPMRSTAQALSEERYGGAERRRHFSRRRSWPAA